MCIDFVQIRLINTSINTPLERLFSVQRKMDYSLYFYFNFRPIVQYLGRKRRQVYNKKGGMRPGIPALFYTISRLNYIPKGILISLHYL